MRLLKPGWISIAGKGLLVVLLLLFALCGYRLGDHTRAGTVSMAALEEFGLPCSGRSVGVPASAGRTAGVTDAINAFGQAFNRPASAARPIGRYLSKLYVGEETDYGRAALLHMAEASAGRLEDEAAKSLFERKRRLEEEFLAENDPQLMKLKVKVFDDQLKLDLAGAEEKKELAARLQDAKEALRIEMSERRARVAADMESYKAQLKRDAINALDAGTMAGSAKLKARQKEIEAGIFFVTLPTEFAGFNFSADKWIAAERYLDGIAEQGNKESMQYREDARLLRNTAYANAAVRTAVASLAREKGLDIVLAGLPLPGGLFDLTAETADFLRKGR